MSTTTQLEDPYASQTKNMITLTRHCVWKGVQLGSVLGIVIATPILLFTNYKKEKKFQLHQFAKYQIYSLLAGVGVSLGMMTYKYFSWQNKQQCLRDRAYRIDHNVLQNNVDQVTFGAFLGSVFISLFKIRNLVIGLGMITPAIFAGLLFHAVTTIRPQVEKATKQELAQIENKEQHDMI